MNAATPIATALLYDVRDFDLGLVLLAVDRLLMLDTTCCCCCCRSDARVTMRDIILLASLLAEEEDDEADESVRLARVVRFIVELLLCFFCGFVLCEWKS